MIRVVVSGICGRMGGMVAQTIAASEDLVLVGGLEMPTHESVGRRLCDLWTDADSSVVVSTRLDELERGSYDVLVDFSIAPQAVACAERASADGLGLIIGTTGLTEFEIAAIQAASKRTAIVIAPNTSLGINMLFGLVRSVAERLGESFDVEIVEAHHNAKKDAPSGTAAKLAQIVADARGVGPGMIRVGRSGLDAARRPGEIGVHAVRAGGITGRHTVHLVSETEEFTLSHTAFSRKAFAAGALKAVRFVHGKPPGLYDMMDVLDL
ncbi:4-hydroxy-tetrahydrodipicolinate reductase [bacterium]|nr:4-hydroxy-tetrahydrodipicolinate reductase [bacterium]